ncbi:alpha/beta fold hydrolase [Actinocorallia populi]|uniref:alpha/beta fold hydrolase n=1 Tax=Actinocorallia populi TaxID=2079200 RepID=UPI000D089C20|nr:alpha/beta hydrolase [Actinocorallia populi]
MDIVLERRGKGPQLVLLPGPGRRDDWEPVTGLLARDHEVLVLGDTPDGLSATADPESLAVHLELAFTGLGLRTPHIAGDSLGGLLALEAAERALVASATALSPAGFAPRTGSRRVDLLLQTVRLGASLPGAVLERLLVSPLQESLRFRTLYGRPHPVDAEALVVDPGAVWDPAPARPRESVRFTGELADVPVTLAWGGRDRPSPPDEALRARERLPHVRHMWLPGGGALPRGCDPEAVAGIIRNTVAAAEGQRFAVGS